MAILRKRMGASVPKDPMVHDEDDKKFVHESETDDYDTDNAWSRLYNLG